jgi:cobalt-zinc-cadmium efflux system protein
MYALSCHTLIDDLPPSGSSPILQSLTTMLNNKYHIGHATIQFECNNKQGGCCEMDGLYCRMEAVKEKCNGHQHTHEAPLSSSRESISPFERQ